MSITVSIALPILLGLVLGSFATAMIYRVPRSLKIFLDRSRCPACDTVLGPMDLFPFFSFLYTRGRCRFIEIFMALISFSIFPYSITVVSLVIYLLKLSILTLFIIHFFIDLEFKILPDSINLALILPLGILAILDQPPLNIFLGALVGFSIPYFITYLFYLYKGVVGLGGGDIKLFTVLGIYLGPEGVTQNIFLSCFIGSLYSIILILRRKVKRDDALAFGPFIIIVAFTQIFYPDFYHHLFSKVNSILTLISL